MKETIKVKVNKEYLLRKLIEISDNHKLNAKEDDCLRVIYNYLRDEVKEEAI